MPKKENKSKLVASICKKLEAEGTDEELEYLRELWKSEERKTFDILRSLNTIWSNPELNYKANAFNEKRGK